MRIVLLKDVDRVGRAGEIVQVADGFARNFLIPQRQALLATDANVARFESQRKQHEATAEREKTGVGHPGEGIGKGFANGGSTRRRRGQDVRFGYGSEHL